MIGFNFGRWYRQTARTEWRAPTSSDGGPFRPKAAAKYIGVLQSPCGHCKCRKHCGGGCAIFSRLLLHFTSFWLLGHSIQICRNGLCRQGILISFYLNYHCHRCGLVLRKYGRWNGVKLLLKFLGLVLGLVITCLHGDWNTFGTNLNF